MTILHWACLAFGLGWAFFEYLDWRHDNEFDPRHEAVVEKLIAGTQSGEIEWDGTRFGDFEIAMGGCYIGSVALNVRKKTFRRLYNAVLEAEERCERDEFEKALLKFEGGL